ncbi:MAG: hypothetical protein WC310_02160 [Patescibacteria group bacterium]|jgi:hypothetical protein
MSKLQLSILPLEELLDWLVANKKIPERLAVHNGIIKTRGGDVNIPSTLDAIRRGHLDNNAAIINFFQILSENQMLEKLPPVAAKETPNLKAVV